MKKILLTMIHGLLPILGIILIVSIIALAIYFAGCLGVNQDIAVVIVLIIVAWPKPDWYKPKDDNK